GHLVPDVVTNNRTLFLITIVLEDGGHIHFALGFVHTSGFTWLSELALVNFLAVLVQEGFDPVEATLFVGDVLGGGVYARPVDLDAFEGRHELGVVLAFRNDALVCFVHVVRSLVQLEREGGALWNLTGHIRFVDERSPNGCFWGRASDHGNRKRHLRVVRDIDTFQNVVEVRGERRNTCVPLILVYEDVVAGIVEDDRVIFVVPNVERTVLEVNFLAPGHRSSLRHFRGGGGFKDWAIKVHGGGHVVAIPALNPVEVTVVLRNVANGDAVKSATTGHNVIFTGL